MAVYKKDDRVRHPDFGFGTVLDDEQDGYLRVLFDNKDKETILALQYAQLELVGAATQLSREIQWLQTFYPEDSTACHFMGSHWDPFFAHGVDDVVVDIPTFIREARTVSAYADFKPPPRRPPPAWVKGAYLAWPDQHAGLQIVLGIEDKANYLVSLFPFIRQGSQHGIVIDRVVVWENGLEAQIRASLADASVDFYDTQFIANRAWYEAGKTYQFIRAGIAYQCRQAENTPIVIDPPPRWLKELRDRENSGEWLSGDSDKPMTIHCNGMASLVPLPKGDIDEYSFHGPIRACKEIHILDQPAWLLRTTVLRSLDYDADIDLDIVVTGKIWQNSRPPQIGEDIEGVLWLQGYLWHPGKFDGVE